MATSSKQIPLSVALIGNPNTGKSTLFGGLVGVRQRVGNYPGVTVEKKTGQMTYQGRRWEFVDLPGLYSLAPRSRDEMVAVDVLLGRYQGSTPVDAVICIVDASNLRRNLYLVNQVLELGLPTVLALNMLDVADQRGVSLDTELLAERLGVPVVRMQANQKIGLDALKESLAEVVDRPSSNPASPLPAAFQKEVDLLASLFTGPTDGDGAEPLPRYLVERLLLDTGGYLQKVLLPKENGPIRRELDAARGRLAETDCEVPGVETTARYEWIQRVLEGAMTAPPEFAPSASDRLDRVLTHRLWGTLVFALVMVVVFQSVFTWAGPFMDGIDAGFSGLGAWVEAHMAEGALRSLLVDGVLAGVGGVVVFMPQILILFLFIAVLEDCGYMSRAAYLMDKIMVRAGLSGKSFIPLLSGFACAIPGIMAARVIEDERDRLTTILVAPLMTCSARLPIYALLIAAFIPNQPVLGPLGLQGITLIGLYALGIVVAVCAALVLKKTLLRGDPPPFVMELPSYKWPSPRTVLHRMTERAWLFVRCAGTMILAVSIVVWAALYYPHDTKAALSSPGVVQLQTQLDQLGPHDPRSEAVGQRLQNAIAGELQRQSLLGTAGRTIEPLFRPLGWDWKISCAAIASFPAREIVVATLGVMYNLGEGVDAETEEGISQFSRKLHHARRDDTGEKVFTIPVALSIMVFFALCAQCVATLAVIKRETNSWRWPAFTFTYMTTLAYLAAMVTYQVGTWMG